MKKLSGIPLSKFVSYSKMRRNVNNPIQAKKLKKKRKHLLDVLPTNPSLTSEDVNSVFKQRPVKQSRKKCKSNVSKKGVKASLANGNSSAAKESKKIAKLKKSKKKLLIDDSSDASCVEPLSTDQSKSLQTPLIEKMQVHPTNGSSPKDKNRIIPPKIRDCGESNQEQSIKSDLKASISRCLNNNPVEDGKSLFQWLINPLSIDDFFK